MRKLASIIAVACGLYGSSIAAQDLPAMRTIIDVEQDLQQKCNITTASVNASTLASMRYNRIALTDNASAPALQVTIGGNATNTHCFAAITVIISRFMPLTFNLNHEILGEAMYCNSLGYVITDKWRFTEEVNDLSKRAIEQCLAELETFKLSAPVD